MSLVETKEVIKILATTTVILTIMFFIALYAIAKITYKKAHKTKKVYKTKRNVNVIFNLDSKNKTLQEIQLEKAQMINLLGGF
jgi:preprotein translocase subunit SecG